MEAKEAKKETGVKKADEMAPWEALDYLRNEWGWPGLEEIRRYLSTPPRYVAIVWGQSVELGTAETLLNQKKLRLKVFEATHHLLRWVDQRYWDDIVKIIVLATIDYEAPEAEELDWLMGLLEAYLDAHKPASEEDEAAWRSHVRMELPVERGGTLLVHATHLAAWASARGNRVRPREMAFALRKFGAESVRIHVGTAHRRYWELPRTLVPWYDGGVDESVEADKALGTQGVAVAVQASIGEKHEHLSHEEGVVAPASAPSSTQNEQFGATVPHEKNDVAPASAPSSTAKREPGATSPDTDEIWPGDPEKAKSSGDVAPGGKNIVPNGINPGATSSGRSGTGGTGGVGGVDEDDDWIREWL